MLGLLLGLGGGAAVWQPAPASHWRPGWVGGTSRPNSAPAAAPDFAPHTAPIRPAESGQGLSLLPGAYHEAAPHHPGVASAPFSPAQLEARGATRAGGGNRDVSDTLTGGTGPSSLAQWTVDRAQACGWKGRGSQWAVKGTYLPCRLDPSLPPQGACQRQPIQLSLPHIHVSLCLSGPLPLALKIYRKIPCQGIQIHGWMDGWMDGWIHGYMDGWMDGWMWSG